MSELPGRPSLFDQTVKEVLNDPSAAKALKVLARAKELGWHENPYTSLVIRLGKEGAEPFFARWDLGVTSSGKPSWRFQGARAANGQALNYNDVLIYLEDPDVIYPEPPEDDTPTGPAPGQQPSPLNEFFNRLEEGAGDDCND
jgi:hypothetical protein